MASDMSWWESIGNGESKDRATAVHTPRQRLELTLLVPVRGTLVDPRVMHGTWH